MLFSRSPSRARNDGVQVLLTVICQAGTSTKKTTKVINKKEKKQSDIRNLSLINYDAVENVLC